ncbi:hypothetical protein F5Y07DRAFT_88821 [Xylaria sp. FL0933]|nr:hypothetical protein F5Y07DRAFT_88821 [Xylaria sp. FL0933]
MFREQLVHAPMLCLALFLQQIEPRDTVMHGKPPSGLAVAPLPGVLKFAAGNRPEHFIVMSVTRRLGEKLNG